MSEKRQHHLKIWLAVFLVLGILGMMLYTDAGKKTLSVFKVGKFVKPAPADVSRFIVVLNAEKDAFYGLSLSVSDADFVSEGVCQQMIKLGDFTLQKSGTRCKAAISGFKGAFTYTQAGSIQINGDSLNVLLDDTSYSSDKPIHIEMEVIPFTFSLDSFEVGAVPLSSVKGELTKLKDDGSVGAIAYLDNSSIEIDNFLGSLRLDNGKTILNGLASSIEGLSW